MQTLRSLQNLRPTPAMLADNQGKTLFRRVALGLITSVADLEFSARRAGRGEDYVRATDHYKAARAVLSLSEVSRG